ncbi:MAG TPA: hypothetical protein VK081_03625 [Planctomycetota bacterium]|nr:hypothetical protein [Planctomycetota bacterium]
MADALPGMMIALRLAAVPQAEWPRVLLSECRTAQHDPAQFVRLLRDVADQLEVLMREPPPAKA